MDSSRRCVRCQRLLYPWHPVDKPLCTTCSPQSAEAQKSARKVAGAESRKLSRLKLLEKGLCQVCGTPRAEGHQTLCEEHRQRHNEYVRRFAYRRAHNLCTICGGRKAFAAKPRCEKCSGKPRSQARR